MPLTLVRVPACPWHWSEYRKYDLKHLQVSFQVVISYARCLPRMMIWWWRVTLGLTEVTVLTWKCRSTAPAPNSCHELHLSNLKLHPPGSLMLRLLAGSQSQWRRHHRAQSSFRLDLHLVSIAKHVMIWRMRDISCVNYMDIRERLMYT